MIKRGVYRFEEVGTEARSLVVVLNGGSLKFSEGFRLGSERAGHRPANRRPTRARTSSHGSPGD